MHTFTKTATNKLNSLLGRNDFVEVHSVRAAQKHSMLVLEFECGKTCSIDNFGSVKWFDSEVEFAKSL